MMSVEIIEICIFFYLFKSPKYMYVTGTTYPSLNNSSEPGSSQILGRESQSWCQGNRELWGPAALTVCGSEEQYAI